MIKYSDVKELSVVSIANGVLVGVLDSLAFKHQSNKIAAFIIKAPNNKKLILEESHVVGFGSNASITDVKAARLMEYIDNENLINVDEFGDSVITIKGEMLGTLREVFVEKESKKIVQLIIEKGQEQRIVKGDDIVCLGKDFVIVNAETDMLSSMNERFKFSNYSDEISGTHSDGVGLDSGFDFTEVEQVVNTESNETQAEDAITFDLEDFSSDSIDFTSEHSFSDSIEFENGNDSFVNVSEDKIEEASELNEANVDVLVQEEVVRFEDEKINDFYVKNKGKRITKDIPDYNGKFMIKSGDIVDEKFMNTVLNYNPQLFDIIEWFLV